MVDEQGDAETNDDATTLVMYCRSWCSDCARARAWLEENEIPFVEVDVDADSSARLHAANLNEGRLHTPTFKFGDGVCVDFRVERLKDLLDIDD